MIYSAIFFIVMCICIPLVLPYIYKGVREVITVNSVPAIIGTISAVLNFSLLILIYFWEMWNSKKIKKYLNDMAVMSEFEECLFKIASSKDMSNPLYYLFLKIFLCEVLNIVFNILSSITLAMQFEKEAAYVGFVAMYPYIAQFTISTYIFMGTLRTKFFFMLLNKNILKIVNELKQSDVSQMKDFQRITFSCNLSDRLDEYAIYYNHLSKTIKGLLDLYSYQLLLLIVNNFVTTTFQIFMQYVVILLEMRGNIQLNMWANISSLIFLIIGYLDFILHGIVAQQIRTEAQRTGLILHRIPTSQMDIRFQRSIELFSLLVLHEQPKVEVCGILILDIGFVSSTIDSIDSVIVCSQHDAQEWNTL
uniref:Gustatory receptor n=1 Tax=Phlebotomus papatasi TaxID=29031 RepID=A0A1B0D4U6_PHLPP